MASLNFLGRFKSRLNILCELSFPQHIRVPRQSLSLSCPVYEKDNSGNENSEKGKVEKYRQVHYSNPLQRTIKILSGDVKQYYRRKKDTIEQIMSEAKADADMKAGITRTKTAKKKVYDFEPGTSGEEGAVWPSHCDVLVVGGGAVGSSVAYHLKEHARDGLNVVVVEEDPTYKRASTVLSVGGIRQQFSIPENILLSMYGMEFLRNSPQLLAVEGLDPPDMQFNPCGYLTLASEEGYKQLRENYELQRDVGAKVSLLSTRQLADMYPWLNVSGLAAGVIGRENEGWFDPWSLLISLQRKAISLGTQYVKGKVTGFSYNTLDDLILEGTSRSNIKRLQCAEVTMANGEKRTINFALLVVAAGAWVGDVGRLAGIGEGKDLLGVPIPIEPRKRYVYCVHAPDGPGLNAPLMIDPNGTYFRREGLGGLYLCGQSPPEDREPPADNLDVDYTFFDEQVWPNIAKRVPSFENLKLHSAWSGYYDYNTFDQNGIIGVHPLFSNMFIAGGFSGHGIQQAAGVGRAIMECIIYGEYRTINLERFGFERILAQEPLLETNIV